MRTKRTFHEPCGCTYRVDDDREQWTDLCDQHRVETEERHQRAAQQHGTVDEEFVARLFRESPPVEGVDFHVMPGRSS